MSSAHPTPRPPRADPSVWAAAERVLVAVGPSPLSERLVRSAARMAGSLDVPWHAVTVQPVRSSGLGAERAALMHLRLAEQLGAETATVSSERVPEALIAYARRINATMLVLGAPTRRTWRERLGGTLLDQVIRLAADIEVHVVVAEPEAPTPQPPPHAPTPERARATLPSATDLGVGMLTAAAATGLASLVEPLASESDIIMVYVAAVAVAAFRVRLIAGLATALVCALAFNFFFTEPRYTLYVHDSRYWLTFLMMGGVGGLVATLVARLREHAAVVLEREAQGQELFRLTRRLGGCRTEEQVAEVAADQLHRLFAMPVAVLLPGPAGLEQRAARGGMPARDGQALPLHRDDPTQGMICIAPTAAGRLDEPDQQHLLETVVALVAELLDRLRLESRADAARLQVETERIRNTLLSSVSHDLRTPLATITGAATTLLDPGARLSDETRLELLSRIATEARRLERLLANVLHMTRLDDGGLAPSLDWEVPDEIVAGAVARVAPLAQGRPIILRCPDGPALARLDAVLIEQLVMNYLENALHHAPSDTPIELTLRSLPDEITLEVADRGPGLGEVDAERLFEKFVRGHPSGASGAGLGLAICRAIARLHGGRTWARERAGGGSVFGVALPRGGPDHQAVPVFQDILDQTEDP